MKDKLNKAIELLESMNYIRMSDEDNEKLVYILVVLKQMQKENYIKVNVGVDKNNIGGMNNEEI